MSALVRDRDAALDVTVGDGETVAVLGPNGAGKSTLLGLLAGLVRADSGRATLDGDVLFDVERGIRLPPFRRRIALLDQRASLFPHLNALGNVTFGARSVAAAGARERAALWLGEVGAFDLADRRATALSGGQAQRVALARALAAEPRLVLLDEPLAAVDVAQAAALRRMLARVLECRTALVATHDILDVWALADRVILIEEGRVVSDGPTAEVLATPPTRFLAELTGVGLVEGVLVDAGLRLPDGRVLAGSLSRGATVSEQDARVRAVVDPAAVRLAGSGIRARVRSIEPRGATVRIRTDLVPADVPAERAATLSEGDELRLELPRLVLEPMDSRPR